MMAPSFPGMNPYLETPALWPEVHSWLIVSLARFLNPLLVPKYRAAVEKRVYLETGFAGIPDASIFQPRRPTPPQTSIATTGILSEPRRVTLPLEAEVTERYLEIREVETQRVVTVIELLSPKNKRLGEGREQYLRKRQKMLNSATHWVEIDLLRTGAKMPLAEEIESDYRILVSRFPLRPEAELYPFNLRDSIPQFLLPLQLGDREPIVNLKEILNRVYEEAALEFALDYLQQPVPSLNEEDFQWVQSLN